MFCFVNFRCFSIFQVKNVRDHQLENRMESFFLAETTKYLYLIFDTQNFIHNSGGHGSVIWTPGGQCVVDAGRLLTFIPLIYSASFVYCLLTDSPLQTVYRYMQLFLQIFSRITYICLNLLQIFS